MKIAEMNFKHIKEIYIKGKSYDIIIVGMNGKRVKINTAIEFIEELSPALLTAPGSILNTFRKNIRTSQSPAGDKNKALL